MKYFLLIGFALGFVVGVILIPAIISLSFRKGFLDKPDERKIHHINVPRLGGTCFYPIAMLVGAVMISMAPRFNIPNILQVFHYTGINILYGLVGALLLFGFGVIDDLWGVRYRTKFIGQIVAGVLLFVGGTWLVDLHGMFGFHEVSNWMGMLITIFAIVFVTNAINFIDGIDGLASTICFFVLAYFAAVFYLLHAYDFTIVTVATMGPLFAFMMYNIFGSAKRHTKTFMGDTGSLFLGYLICALGIALNRILSLPSSTIVELPYLNDFNPMALSFAPIILPCLDVIRVVLVRHRQGKNPFIADKNHIHHKFLSMGLDQHVVLAIVVLMAVAFSALTIWLSKYLNINIVLLIVVVLWTAINFLVKNKNASKKTT